MIKFLKKEDSEAAVLMRINNSGLTLDELLTMFKRFCFACGYHSDNIKNIVDVTDYGYEFDEVTETLVETESTDNLGF